MSVNKAIKLYRSKGLLNDNDHDLPAIEALFDAGYTIKWHGQGSYDTAWCGAWSSLMGGATLNTGA